MEFRSARGGHRGIAVRCVTKNKVILGRLNSRTIHVAFLAILDLCISEFRKTSLQLGHLRSRRPSAIHVQFS